MKRFLLFVLLLIAAGGILDSSERSSRWPAVRREYLVTHRTCEACGRSVDVDVHHIIPVSNDPCRELDPTNLITLCPRCHLVFGHFGNWQHYNPQVREHAVQYRAWKVEWERD